MKRGTRAQVRANDPLLLVSLDDVGVPHLSCTRVEAGFVEGATLSQQVPVAVELNLDRS